MTLWLVQYPLLFPSWPQPGSPCQLPELTRHRRVVPAQWSRLSGTGLRLLRKAGFFSDPASCQHGACPSPARGVSSHSGWISMSPLMRRWTRELPQTGAEQALFNQRLKSSLQLRQLICNGSRQDKPGYKSWRMCYSAWLWGFALAASDSWDLIN